MEDKLKREGQMKLDQVNGIELENKSVIVIDDEGDDGGKTGKLSKEMISLH